MKIFLLVSLSQALLCTALFDNNVYHAIRKIVPGNAKFSSSFYAHLAEKYPKDNLWFSPMSISLLFSMLSVGAKAQTRDQMYNALGFNMSAISEEDINRGFQNLLQVLNQPNTDLELSSANAIFVNQHAKLIEKFSEDLKNFYESEAIFMDFQDGDEAKTQINSYVENKTNGKIKDLLQSLSPQTLLVLTNSIYFKVPSRFRPYRDPMDNVPPGLLLALWHRPWSFHGKDTGVVCHHLLQELCTWMNAFYKADMIEEDFHVDENTIVKVTMLKTVNHFYAAIEQKMGCVVVEVPYEGNISAILILPDNGKFQEVERAARNVSVKHWFNFMYKREIHLSIPTFCLSATLNLKNELPHLGMTDVFSGHADLSGMTEDHVEVSEAFHKAVLSVDEKGGDFRETSIAVNAGFGKFGHPFEVVANRPFLLSLLHKPTDTILFTGRVMKPEKC